MSVTILNPQQFLLEVRRWGIGQESLVRVRMMKVGDFIFMRFHTPHTYEIIETKITLEEYRKYQFTNIAPIATPAIWRDDHRAMKNIEKRLTDLKEVLGGVPITPQQFSFGGMNHG